MQSGSQLHTDESSTLRHAQQVPGLEASESPEAKASSGPRLHASAAALSSHVGAGAMEVGPRAGSGPLSLGLSTGSLSFPPLPPAAAAGAEYAVSLTGQLSPQPVLAPFGGKAMTHRLFPWTSIPAVFNHKCANV